MNLFNRENYKEIKEIFGRTYDDYINKIYRFIFLKTGIKEVAEDLSSETFLKFFNALKKGTKIENQQAFLYQIARNLIADYYKAKGRTAVVSADLSPIVDPKNLEEKSMVNSDLSLLKAGLVRLKEDEQSIIVWRHLEELSIPEIAKLVDKSESATRVMLHRAMNSLKEALNNRHKEA